jgi:hypothetical protein
MAPRFLLWHSKIIIRNDFGVLLGDPLILVYAKKKDILRFALCPFPQWCKNKSFFGAFVMQLSGIVY